MGDRDLEEPGGSAEIDADRLKETIPHRSQNGYLSERRIYACHHGADCPLKPNCTQAQRDRRSKVSLALRRYRHQARDNLLSEHGTRLRKQRGMVLEGSFGNIKHNLGFRYYACFFALLTQPLSIAHEYRGRLLSFVVPEIHTFAEG